MGDLPAIALTAGEPAGIGPELCLAVAARSWPARLRQEALPVYWFWTQMARPMAMAWDGCPSGPRVPAPGSVWQGYRLPGTG